MQYSTGSRIELFVRAVVDLDFRAGVAEPVRFQSPQGKTIFNSRSRYFFNINFTIRLIGGTKWRLSPTLQAGSSSRFFFYHFHSFKFLQNSNLPMPVNCNQLC